MARRNRRNEILRYIQQKYEKDGFPPSLNQIAAHLGLNAKSNIHRQLGRLLAEGRIINSGGKYLPSSSKNAGAAVLVPLLGKVAAGQPILAAEEFEEYVAYLPRFGDGKDLFALKIKGDSMTGAGLFEGDVAIVEKTPQAENGDIVVALIGDEATVKRFYFDGKTVRLTPENPAFEAIVTKEAVILGRVIASQRYFKGRGF
jgi:repressor LexA